MGFSNEWESQYLTGHHLSRWPWTDLISLVMRYASPKGGYGRVLELGCGAGANIPFFEALGVDYHSIEGSRTAVSLIHERFPHLRQKVVVGDYTERIPFPGVFDLVVDRSSLTCNDTESIRRCLHLLESTLRVEGRFIAVDWFSVDHDDYEVGEDAGDGYTRHNFSSGDFAGTGNVHFFDKPHLQSIFGDYELLSMQHKRLYEEFSDGGARHLATWNLVAERRPGAAS